MHAYHHHPLLIRMSPGSRTADTLWQSIKERSIVRVRIRVRARVRARVRVRVRVRFMVRVGVRISVRVRISRTMAESKRKHSIVDSIKGENNEKIFC
jgi:hypothetical protein